MAPESSPFIYPQKNASQMKQTIKRISEYCRLQFKQIFELASTILIQEMQYSHDLYMLFPIF